MNYLANALPLNGRNTGQLSDDFPNLFVPAGLTFAIWGVIYLLLFIWIGAQWFAFANQEFAKRFQPHLERIGLLFAASCLFNCFWIIAWHWSVLWLSIALMIGLLTTMIRINLKLDKPNESTGIARAAFGIYQGWLSIALIANITALLVHAGWRGAPFSEVFWTVAVMLVGLAIAVYMVIKRGQAWHGVAVAWAFYGIYLKRSTLADAPPILWVALAAMAVALLCVVLQWRKVAVHEN
jgi:translocator protein